MIVAILTRIIYISVTVPEYLLFVAQNMICLKWMKLFAVCNSKKLLFLNAAERENTWIHYFKVIIHVRFNTSRFARHYTISYSHFLIDIVLMFIIDPRSMVHAAAASMVEAVVGGQNHHPYVHSHHEHTPIKSEPNESSEGGTLKSEREEGKGNTFYINMS